MGKFNSMMILTDDSLRQVVGGLAIGGGGGGGGEGEDKDHDRDDGRKFKKIHRRDKDDEDEKCGIVVIALF